MNYNLQVFITTRYYAEPFRLELVQQDAGHTGSFAPADTVIMLLAIKTSSCFGLIFGKDSQDTENHGNLAIELHAHQTMRNSIADVFKMHRLAFDQNPDGYDGIKGTF